MAIPDGLLRLALHSASVEPPVPFALFSDERGPAAPIGYVDSVTGRFVSVAERESRGWRCAYCGGLRASDLLQCPGCGAARKVA
jgi:hypothetical protein